MGRELRLFKSQERKSRSELSAFIHQLADKISEGRIVLKQNQEELVVQLPQTLVLEVQVEDEDKGTKGTQHSMEIEIKWFDDEHDATVELG